MVVELGPTAACSYWADPHHNTPGTASSAPSSPTNPTGSARETAEWAPPCPWTSRPRETYGLVGESGMREDHPRPRHPAAHRTDRRLADLRRAEHRRARTEPLRVARRRTTAFQDPLGSLDPLVVGGVDPGRGHEAHGPYTSDARARGCASCCRGGPADHRRCANIRTSSPADSGSGSGSQGADRQPVYATERSRRHSNTYRWVHGQRPCDADPLPLSAGELVRVFAQRGVRQANRGQHSRSRAFVCSSDVSRPCAFMPSSRIDCTDCRGSSDPSGSWKTICIRRRATRSGSGLSSAMFSRSKITEPSVGSVSRRMPRPRVVFPHSDSPTRPYVSRGLEVHGQGGAPFGGLRAEPVGLVGEEGADEAVPGCCSRRSSPVGTSRVHPSTTMVTASLPSHHWGPAKEFRGIQRAMPQTSRSLHPSGARVNIPSADEPAGCGTGVSGVNDFVRAREIDPRRKGGPAIDQGEPPSGFWNSGPADYGGSSSGSG